MIFVTMNTNKIQSLIFFLFLMSFVLACNSKEREAQKAEAMTPISKFKISSSSFDSGAVIPDTFTCKVNQQIFPNLSWTGSHEKTKSYVLIMDDPDAKQVVGYVWNHWLLYDIPSSTQSVGEGKDAKSPLPLGTKSGTTSFNDTTYGGPCPPPGQVHHYYFKLYALDIDKLNVANNGKVAEVREAMKGHVLDSAEYVGLFQR